MPVGQSPGRVAGAGHDIPSRPPGTPDGGYHRAMQQAGNGGNGVAFAAKDGGHEDDGYFGGPLSSVFGGPELGHGPTAYVLQLPTSGRNSGTGCDILRSSPQYIGSNNGYGTIMGPQQQYGRGSRSYRAKPFVRHYRGGDGTAPWPQQQHGPRPFSSFGWEQRAAYHDGPSVNGRAHGIAQGQAQRDVEMDCHGGPVSKVSRPPERGGGALQARHQRGLQPPSGILSPPAAVISDSAFEEWLQSNEIEMQMFSLSKGQRQQPPNSAASVGGVPASSAVAAASAGPSEAEPATSGFPWSHQGGPSGRANRVMERCHRTRQRRRHRRPAILLPLQRRRGGRLERSRRQLGSLTTAGRGRSARGVCDFIPEGEYRCGDCHLGRAPFRGVRRPARGWHIRGAGGGIGTRDQHYLGQVRIFLEE